MWKNIRDTYWLLREILVTWPQRHFCGCTQHNKQHAGNANAGKVCRWKSASSDAHQLAVAPSANSVMRVDVNFIARQSAQHQFTGHPAALHHTHAGRIYTHIYDLSYDSHCIICARTETDCDDALIYTSRHQKPSNWLNTHYVDEAVVLRNTWFIEKYNTTIDRDTHSKQQH